MQMFKTHQSKAVGNKMRVILLCNSSPTPPISRSQTSKSSSFCCCNWGKKTLTGAISGALSLGLLVSLPSSSSFAFESLSMESLAPSSSTDTCLKEEQHEAVPETVVTTNEGIVEEAWEIVNDTFLDSGNHRWSSESWQVLLLVLAHA